MRLGAHSVRRGCAAQDNLKDFDKLLICRTTPFPPFILLEKGE